MDQQETDQYGGTPQTGMQEIDIEQYDMEQQLMPQEIMPQRTIISRAGFALFIMAIVVLLTQFSIEILVRIIKPEIAESTWYAMVVTAISIVGVGLPVYSLMMKRIPNSTKGEVVKMKFSHFIVLFFICTAVMYITNFFSVFLTMIIALLKGEDIMSLVNPLQEVLAGSNFIITLIYASLVAPIVEELIFRKLLLDKLRRFGDVPAILMTGFAFGLFHMNLSQFFYATALGFIFAYITIKTNTVRYSIILHIMINFIGTIVAPMATKQNAIFSLIIMFWMLTAITLGVVFFILNVKKIKLERAAIPVEKKSIFFINLGTILYTVVCLVMITYVTLL
ncbi:MAG: CPBP family intramembrane glutamic endopeptidase [Mobilitalea sp.]